MITFVVDHRNLLWLKVECTRLVSRYIDDVEAALLKHTIERTVTLAKSKRLRSIVVGNIDGSKLTLLIVIVGTLVLIELELTILASIDIQRDIIMYL